MLNLTSDVFKSATIKTTSVCELDGTIFNTFSKMLSRTNINANIRALDENRKHVLRLLK